MTGVVNKSTVQIQEKATQKFVNKYKEIFQNNMAEGQNDPQGPFFYQEGGKTYASLPLGMIQGKQQSLIFDKMQKDCKAEGIELPKKHYGKGPEDSCANATGIFTKHGSRDNASDEQSQCAEGNGQEGNCE